MLNEKEMTNLFLNTLCENDLTYGQGLSIVITLLLTTATAMELTDIEFAEVLNKCYETYVETQEYIKKEAMNEKR